MSPEQTLESEPRSPLAPSPASEPTCFPKCKPMIVRPHEYASKAQTIENGFQWNILKSSDTVYKFRSDKKHDRERRSFALFSVKTRTLENAILESR